MGKKKGKRSGKKCKGKLKSSRTTVSVKEVHLELTVTFRGEGKKSRKIKGKKEFRKMSVTYHSLYWGYHKRKRKIVPVFDIHGKFGSNNLRVKKSSDLLLNKLKEWKDQGYRVAYIIHGNSKPGGWKDFIMSKTCPYTCTPYREENGKDHPCISVVHLS